MSEDVVYHNFDMENCFFAVAEKVRFLVEDQFNLGKQTGVLIGGNDVEIETGELTIQGHERAPVELIAIKSLKISAANIYASDVVIYVLKDTMVNIDNRLLEGCRVKVIVVDSG